MPSFIFLPPLRRPPRRRGFFFGKPPGMLAVQVTEALTLGDTLTDRLPVLPLTQTDALTVADSVTMSGLLTFNGQAVVQVDDTVTLLIPAFFVAIAESLTLADPVTLIHNATRVVAVTEAMTVDDVIALLQPVLRGAVTEALTLTETVTISGVSLLAQVTEGLTVGEVRLVSATFLAVQPIEPLTLGDVPTVILVARLQVTDALTLGESLVVRRAILGITITEALTLGDSSTLFQFVLRPQPTEALTLAETVTVQSLRLVVAITEGLTVTETMSLALYPLRLQVTEALTVTETLIFLLTFPVITVPNAPLPIEQRHWTDELFLSLQRRESAYNVLIDRWDATTATLMNQVDDQTVHELWDDQVQGQELTRLGFQLPNVQALAQQSIRIAFTQPRVTPHTLAGLLALTLGQVTSTQQPFFTAYRHRITLAPPTQLPSISAQTGHQRNVYTAYGGMKSNGCTLENNGPYLKFSCPLIGSGSRVDTTGTTRAGLDFHPPLAPATPLPTSQRITDLQGGVWYLFPDGAGGLTVNISPPAGLSLNVGTGLTLMAIDGSAARLGMSGTGTIELTPVTPPTGPIVIGVCLLADSAGITWYLWIEDWQVTLSTVPPSVLPTTLAHPQPHEGWLRWGDSRLWVADALAGAFPPAFGQGQTNLGSGAIEISNRVLQVSIQEDNQLLASQAYRVASGLVRSNFHPARQQLTITLALEVDLAQEANDLAAYLTQRPMAFEWQCLGVPVEVIAVTNTTSGSVPDFHSIVDGNGVTWYFQMTALGEYTITASLPGGTGLSVGTGLELLAIDGWRYRFGVDVLGQLRINQTTFLGPIGQIVQVCAIKDVTGVPWFLWIEPPGTLAISRTPPLSASWQQGMIVVCRRLQWRALTRTMQQQTDVLELTGTVEEAPAHESIAVEVYNGQASYLQPA